jgi:hypothetical protein
MGINNEKDVFPNKTVIICKYNGKMIPRTGSQAENGNVPLRTFKYEK